MTFERFETRPPGTIHARKGRKSRVFSRRSESSGNERAKHQVAPMRKIVVGRPGSTAPSAPSPTNTTPSAA